MRRAGRTDRYQWSGHHSTSGRGAAANPPASGRGSHHFGRRDVSVHDRPRPSSQQPGQGQRVPDRSQPPVNDAVRLYDQNLKTLEEAIRNAPVTAGQELGENDCFYREATETVTEPVQAAASDRKKGGTCSAYQLRKLSELIQISLPAHTCYQQLDRTTKQTVISTQLPCPAIPYAFNAISAFQQMATTKRSLPIKTAIQTKTLTDKFLHIAGDRTDMVPRSCQEFLL